MPLSRFGDLERSVLETMWADAGGSPAAADPAGDTAPDPDLGERGWWTVREVHAALAQHRDIAYTTVMTVLDRLARKSAVVQRKDGRAYHYRPRLSRSEMIAELMHDTLADFSGHDRQSALVAFVEDAPEADVDALRRALDRLDS